MLERLSLPRRLTVLLALGVLVLGGVAAVAIWGSVRQGSEGHELETAGENSALALGAEFLAADMNGDQTAYGYELTRGHAGSTAATAPSRRAFVESQAWLTKRLQTLRRRPLTPAGREQLAAAESELRRFRALDDEAWSLLHEAPPARARANAIILGPELRVYSRLASDLDGLAAAERQNATRVAAAVRSTRHRVLAVTAVMLAAGVALAALIALLGASLIGRLRRMQELERELRARETDLLRAKEFAKVGSWTWYPREGRNTWSANARRIYGLPDDAADEEDPELFFRIVHPDDRDEVRHEAEQAFAEARSSTSDFRIVRPADGEMRWVRAQGNVEVDAEGAPYRVVGVVTDVNEAKLAEQELRLSEERLRRIIEVSQIGVLVIEPADGTIEFANPTFCEISGYPLEELVGMHPTTLMAEGRSPVLQTEAMGRLLSGELPRFHTTATMARPDGTLLEVDIVALVVPGSDGRPRLVGTIADKSELLRAEEQLRQRQRLDALGQLAGGVAHDFNNLLTVINGRAALALAEAEGGVRSDLEEIAAAGERARSLVRQLLTFARRESAELEVLELNAVVESTQILLERVLEANVEIEIELWAEPLPVRSEVGQLEQVLVNLAVNARDAMPEGGRLTIRTGCEETGEGPRAVLAVADAGTGMDADTRQRIFEPFFTTKPLGKGTGLGLATVYGIVEQAGGRIDVESELGRGTTFTITLPLVAAAERAGRDRGRPPVAARRLRVLLVDDDPAVLDVSEALLRRGGHEVVSLSDASDVLGVVDREGPFDLLLTDLMMPAISGTELADRLREQQPGLPVLYMSGYVEDRPADGGEAPTGYLSKPFTRAGLEHAIGELVGAEPTSRRREASEAPVE